MKKEELISSVIMCIVCVLVLVGFTIAWFTTGGSSVVTGLQVTAGELSGVKISVVSKGPDIKDDGATFLQQFASFGMPDYTNVEYDVIGYTDVKDSNGVITETNVEVEAPELGPGTSGAITFYVTPDSEGLIFCDVSPMIAVTEDEIVPENVNWYTSENIEECTSDDLIEAHRIALTHIKFYSDENCTVELTAPIRLSWEDVPAAEKTETEKPVTFYWKWDYENDQIPNYDEEDMFLGNHISSMKFEFVFVPQ